MNRTGNGVVQISSSRARLSLVSFTIRLVQEKPLAAAGLAITLILLFVGVFADLLAPYGMNETHVADRLTAPSAEYWLGTDDLGRDLLTRIIFGARVSVIVGLSASILATVISLIIGMFSGYIGGKLDLVVQRFVDAVMTLPGLILMIVLMALIGRGMWEMIIVLGINGGISGSRILRGPTISIKGNMFIVAAAAVGCTSAGILTRHILPNIIAPMVILFSVNVPAMILTEASLSFLGFGLPPPAPSWGGMLSGVGRTYMFQAPWMVIWPGLALSIVVYGINVFGDGVRDILDPRLIGGVGRYGALPGRLTSRKSAI